MSDDRFELELRDVLRAETIHAPVVLTLAELQRRARSESPRRRWFRTDRLVLGVATAAIAAVAVLVSINPLRPPQSIGGPSSVPSTAIEPTSLGSTSAVPATPVVAMPIPVSLGEGGNAVILRIRGDALDIVSVRPDQVETPIVRIARLSWQLGDWRPIEPKAKHFAATISATGVLAMTVTRGGSDAPEYATAILRLLGKTAPAVLAQTGDLAFLRDGTLVIASDTVVTVRPPYVGWETMTPPRGVSLAASPGGPRLSLLADGSGVYGARQDAGPNPEPFANLTPVAVAWDGAVTNVDPTINPLLVTGRDRAFGAAGQWAYERNDSGGSPEVVVAGPNTSPAESKVRNPIAYAWSPDGRTLYFLTATDVWTFDGRKSHMVARPSLATDPFRIAGFTPDAILIETTTGDTHAVHLDGTSKTDSLGGVLLAVVG